jgi:hypothetical protein
MIGRWKKDGKLDGRLSIDGWQQMAQAVAAIFEPGDGWQTHRDRGIRQVILRFLMRDSIGRCDAGILAGRGCGDHKSWSITPSATRASMRQRGVCGIASSAV